jgi:aspartyl-tRNA(Asn)/glutamyl-tRNA(Gln) amidotransferase subunit A
VTRINAVHSLGPVALRRKYESGSTTPAEVMAEVLDRIATRNGELGAYTFVAPDEPKAFDARLPLSGIPFAVKDLIDVEGQVTRAGSLVTSSAGPATATATASIVTALRAAGAVLVGRTTTHEFAWGITTRHPSLGGAVNPVNAGRVAGGSSGGSAVAVAAGMASFAIGTDTGGSIRIPANWCGVAGWKPSWGTFPTDGVLPLAPSLDVVGFIAPTVDDLRMLADAIGQHATAPQPGKRQRLGVPSGFDPPLPADIQLAFDAAVDRARSAEVEVIQRPPFDGRPLVEVYRPVQGFEALAVHRDRLGTWPARSSDYGPDVAARLERAASITERDHRDALAEMKDTVRLLDGVDALLLPVAACGPPTLAEPDRAPGAETSLRDLVLPFTVLANLIGGAAVAVPAGLDADGLPVGVQIVARPGADDTALDLATTVEA